MRCARGAAGLLLTAALAVISPCWSGAQSFEFHAPPSAVDPKTPAVMRDLAERLLPVYQEADPDRYLATLSVLQLAADDYASAIESRESLQERRRRADAGRPVGRGRVLDIYARAKAIQAAGGVPFPEAFAKAHQEVFSRLGDHDAFLLSGYLSAAPDEFRENFQRLLDEQRSKDILNSQEAETLLSAYAFFEAYRASAPWVGPLDIADDARRYAQDEIAIRVPGRGKIAATVTRPKGSPAALPALLELGIDRPTVSGKESAAHGYVGVFADARRLAAGAAAFVPYQHDGEVARAIIDWIAKQPWCDGRVAMYGEGYSGFTAWAAAARLPPALKAIAVSDPTAPGIDMPMSGGIFQNSAYRWSLEVTRTQGGVDPGFGDDAVWRGLDEKWYRSGRRYRDLGTIYGRPNPIFIRWLNHPSYDRFWQSMIPYQRQFSRIDFPVLTMTGYFTAAEPAALYYFTEHHRFNPRADHTLLIGPYDGDSMQRGVSGSVRGYQVDAAALLDLRELRYQWLDHALKAAAPPAPLLGPVNFEVMGANEWRHVESLQAMADASLKFYLGARAADAAEGRRLIRRRSPKPAAVTQVVSLTDRSDAAWLPPSDLITRNLVTHNSLTFVSGPFKRPTDFNGLLSGRLDFSVNKMDMDIDIAAYALTSDGDYVRLFNPADELRLSYAADRVHRHLLEAGERQKLSFRGQRMTSRRLEAGSRLVIVLRVSKRPDREINYGTGNDVSEESIEDGKTPIKVRWYNDSYIEIPTAKVPTGEIPTDKVPTGKVPTGEVPAGTAH
jgi:putative CocE/NonD family hydrolase